MVKFYVGSVGRGGSYLGTVEVPSRMEAEVEARARWPRDVTHRGMVLVSEGEVMALLNEYPETVREGVRAGVKAWLKANPKETPRED